ncbi:MAG: FAD-dependent oxidoreductase, partial [Terriglobales bacterium]
LIPGLEQARFLRYGQVHRNSYVLAPAVLRADLSLRAQPRTLVAGQLCGTEGYVEAIATGYLAGVFAAGLSRGEAQSPPPRATAMGSLLHYITHSSLQHYAPANMTLDLLPALESAPRDRELRRRQQCRRALAAHQVWLEAQPVPA